MAGQGLLVAHETVPSEAGGPPRIEYQLTGKGDEAYFALLRQALSDRQPGLDVLGAAVGLIADLPRDEALQMLRVRARAMDEWRESIITHLPTGTDLDDRGPVGEVLTLWLTTADYGATWTHRLIRRLEEGVFTMAGESPAPID
jgi:DNA-binding PadR family transcriptional regulator